MQSVLFYLYQLKALEVELSDGSAVPGSNPVWGKKNFIKSQVRVGLGIPSDLNWRIFLVISPSLTTHPLIGETRMVHYFISVFVSDQSLHKMWQVVPVGCLPSGGV